METSKPCCTLKSDVCVYCLSNKWFSIVDILHPDCEASNLIQPFDFHYFAFTISKRTLNFHPSLNDFHHFLTLQRRCPPGRPTFSATSVRFKAFTWGVNHIVAGTGMDNPWLYGIVSGNHGKKWHGMQHDDPGLPEGLGTPGAGLLWLLSCWFHRRILCFFLARYGGFLG